jgi:hypothetical protein
MRGRPGEAESGHGQGQDDSLADLALQRDGRMVIAGVASTGLCLMRIWP